MIMNVNAKSLAEIQSRIKQIQIVLAGKERNHYFWLVKEFGAEFLLSTFRKKNQANRYDLIENRYDLIINSGQTRKVIRK